MKGELLAKSITESWQKVRASIDLIGNDHFGVIWLKRIS